MGERDEEDVQLTAHGNSILPHTELQEQSLEEEYWAPWISAVQRTEL